MEFNFLAAGICGIVSLALGAFWYHEKVFGKAWLKSIGKSAEQMMDGFNMPLVYGLTFIFAAIVALLLGATIELTHGCFNDDGTFTSGSYHTFKHGALHGAMTAILVVLPLSINAMFHRASWSNILINAGFWIVSFALFGGIMDAMH